MTLERENSDPATAALLITVLLYPGGWWPALVIASAIAAFMLVWSQAWESLPAWGTILALLIVGFARSWWVTDNHHLVVIAAVLLWVATDAGGDREKRAEGARLIIGVVFAAAVAAKVATGDFLDGTFGRVWPAYEYRLAGISTRVGAMSLEQVEANIELVEGLSTSIDPESDLQNFHGASRWFVLLFTAWTLGIELVVAGCFLLGRNRNVRRIGQLALLIFCATTYTIVPVQGFAAVLLCLAIACADSTRSEKVFSLAFAGVVMLPITAHLI